jgi:cell division protein FtsZ
MHGARGLLISITGGPDLTLYEVDEAASRIREEVDPDCNIILGATYDPDMTGTIRVSVVATGTDATMVQALEPMKANPTRVPLTAQAMRQAAAERQPVQSPSMQQAEPQYEQSYEDAQEPEFETQVQAAVAEAISHAPEPDYGYQQEDDGIIVEPYTPSGAPQHQLEETPRLIDAPIPSVYVPGSAERPDGQRRMPRTEELPAVARRTLTEQEKQPEEPRNARALFKRLASNVGLNLRSPEPARPVQATEPAADDAAARSAIEAGASRNPRVSAAPEGARGQLDPHGRQQPQGQAKEHIEIPSFLRKHG